MNASNTVNAGALTAQDWANANFSAQITGVTIASSPVVTFKVADAQGKPVVGLGAKTQTATAAVPTYSNLAFTLAKLVPGTGGSASKWVSYIVTTVPTKNATTGVVSAATPTRPTSDNSGTLVDNGDGSYKYTFGRDVTKMKADVAAMTVTGVNDKAALGDLTYEPTVPHRLAMRLYGNAPGTGSNTPTGATTTAGVSMKVPANAIYDFVPATGAALTGANKPRDVVNTASCSSCHEGFTPHGGSYNRVEFCTTCHTDQRAYGYANVESSGGKFAALTETVTTNPVTGIKSYSYAPGQRIADGEVLGNFTVMVHKIHQGSSLVKENYNFANVVFDQKGYSMLDGGQKMCSVCHDASKAVEANHWSTQPTRKACGSCHDGINWATGGGSTLGDKAAATAPGSIVATSGHVGGKATDDSICALCHKPDAIQVYHRTDNLTAHNPTVAEGLANFTYDIKSVSVDAANNTTIEFAIRNNGTPVTYLVPAPGVSNPLVGFTGAPSFLLAWAQPQDGINAPADYNNVGIKQAQAVSVSLAGLSNTAQAANGSMVPSATNAGYYTATLKGTGNWKFPVGATMRAVGLQGYFTQLAGGPVTANTARHAISVVKSVSGDAVRRTVVDSAKCSNCHEWFEGHGGNRVYDVQICVMCHVPGLATSGRGVENAGLGAYQATKANVAILQGWGFDATLPNAALKFPVTSNNMKDLIHGIHAGRDRVEPFLDARGDRVALLDFSRLDFPGKLSNCETCHASGTYGTVPMNALSSTYESINAAYAAAGIAATPALAKASLNMANDQDSVSTPYAAACSTCHDAPSAKSHMSLNGAVVNGTRAMAKTAVESCVTCHGPGKSYDAAAVHK